MADISDLISREEAAKRLEAQAEKWKGSFSGEAFAFAAKIVRGVPSANEPHWATEQAYKNGYEAGKKDALKGVVISNLETTTQWIPVSERLPKQFGIYNVAIKDIDGVHRDCADFDPFDRSWFPTMCYTKNYVVTHWMPLPEPPKGEE